MQNNLSKVNQIETESPPPYQDTGITTAVAGIRKSGQDVRVEDYPDEDAFVYKSQRKNLNLMRPPKFDALKLVSGLLTTFLELTYTLSVDNHRRLVEEAASD